MMLTSCDHDNSVDDGDDGDDDDDDMVTIGTMVTVVLMMTMVTMVMIMTMVIMVTINYFVKTTLCCCCQTCWMSDCHCLSTPGYERLTQGYRGLLIQTRCKKPRN